MLVRCFLEQRTDAVGLRLGKALRGRVRVVPVELRCHTRSARTANPRIEIKLMRANEIVRIVCLLLQRSSGDSPSTDNTLRLLR